MNDTPNDDAANDFRAQLESAAPKRARPREADRSSQSLSRMADESEHLEREDLDHWAPPSALTLPMDDDMYVYRWVAEYVNGQYTPQRLNKAKREGYTFVRIDELPEGYFVDEDSKGDGLARMGGLIMAKMPRKFARQRQAYYARRSSEALTGANQMQGVAGKDSVEENRGTRSLDGRAAGDALRSMARSSV